MSPLPGSPRRPRVAGRRVRAAVTVAGLLAATATTTSLTGLGSAGAAPAGPSATATDGYRPPAIKHVWVIMLENKSYESTFTGLNQNSYLYKTLTSQGALLRQYYGTGHFSQANYISAVSGQAPAPGPQGDCPSYVNVSPGTPAPDGQVYAPTGCVYPASVPTLFNQLDQRHVSWKGYMESMGNDPTREQVTCGQPLPPPGQPMDLTAGYPDPGHAEPASSTLPLGDAYVPKHNPFVWFHSLLDSGACARNVVPLDGLPHDGAPATLSAPGARGIEADLRSPATTPGFSWISPNNCDDAHDATCTVPNIIGTNQGGLFAADQFLSKYVPMIEASKAFQDGGLIDITFDEGFPPYQAFGNSIADLPGVPGVTLAPGVTNPTVPQSSSSASQSLVNTAQSVVACCNELPGPNTAEPGASAFGQDTTPGGGVTGSLILSRYTLPGTISDQPYNHYSFLRSMENLFATGGHLGYAAATGLRPFGPDVYSNPTGFIDSLEATPAAPGSNGIYAARAGTINEDSPAADPATGRPVPDSSQRPANDPYPEPPFPSLGGTSPGPA